MNMLPNSAAARDIANQVHPQTDLRRHSEIGPTIFDRGEGVRVFDDDGKDYIETVAGLWCASLGFSASERIARVAYEQMRTLGYYHTYRHQANHPSIDLAETLIRLAPSSWSGPTARSLERRATTTPSPRASGLRPLSARWRTTSSS